jgi:hypothetical protein
MKQMGTWEKMVQAAVLLVCSVILMFVFVNFRVNQSVYSVLNEVKESVHQLAAIPTGAMPPPDISIPTPTITSPPSATPIPVSPTSTTPSPTPSTSPTPKTAIFPSATTTAAPVSLLFQDGFSDPGSGWTVNGGLSASGYESVYENGELRISKRNSNTGYMNSVLARFGQQSDLGIEVDARQTSSLEDGSYALLFRQDWVANQVKWYGLWVNPIDGTYWIEKNVVSSRSYVTGPTFSTSIKTGDATNRLRVVALGDHIEVYINGLLLTGVTDATFSSGTFGLAVAGVDNTVLFDNFIAYAVTPDRQSNPLSFDSYANVIADDFSDPKSGRWTTQSLSPDGLDLGYVVTVDQSYYHLYVKNQHSFYFSRPVNTPQYTDLMCQVDAVIDPGYVDGAALLYFQWAPGGKFGYSLAVNGQGRYALLRYDNDVAVPIVNWTKSEAVKTGPNQVNQMLVVRRGQSIYGYVNGQMVVDKSDSTYTQGYVCVGGMTEAQKNIDFRFDNFKFVDLAK